MTVKMKIDVVDSVATYQIQPDMSCPISLFQILLTKRIKFLLHVGLSQVHGSRLVATVPLNSIEDIC